MDISLRKAHKIRNRLTERLRSFERCLRPSPVGISVHTQDVEAALNAEKENFEKDYLSYKVLMRVYTSLRDKIYRTNARLLSEQLSLLNEKETLLSKLRLWENAYDTFGDKMCRRPISEIKDEITSAIARNKEAVERVETEKTLYFLEKSRVEQLIDEARQLEKEISDIHDIIESQNNAGTITLSETEVEVLRKEKIL